MLDAKLIKESLTTEQIIKIMKYLGVEKYEDGGECIIFPTICHNPQGTSASMKLYYYDNRKLFFCYTECNESYDIYNLILQVYKLNKLELEGGNTFFNAMLFVINFFKLDEKNDYTRKNHYTIIRDKYRKQNYEVILDEYDDTVLEVYSKYLPVEWTEEGITQDEADKFNIKYYNLKNEIIIPHYDISGHLIGIRSRRLENIEGGKYMPTLTNGVMYKHPLSFNLYGLNVNKNTIQQVRTAIIFEGEKSVIKFEKMADMNYAVACCGSVINKFQINTLLKLGVSEIIIAFDKEFEERLSPEGEKYFMKLYNLCKKYDNYCTMSFIYDTDGLLDKKDSPVDKGKDIFNTLLRKRVVVRN